MNLVAIDVLFSAILLQRLLKALIWLWTDKRLIAAENPWARAVFCDGIRTNAIPLRIEGCLPYIRSGFIALSIRSRHRPPSDQPALSRACRTVCYAIRQQGLASEQVSRKAPSLCPDEDAGMGQRLDATGQGTERGCQSIHANCPCPLESALTLPSMVCTRIKRITGSPDKKSNELRSARQATARSPKKRWRDLIKKDPPKFGSRQEMSRIGQGGDRH
ncbi:hypothetical protein TELCIR_08915 [Teladorsagia circumcincta]|uniref:Uncharacterized protein n=1 Tax=Teladorsagia circumcincta TaxID=45464 RepID=A0A2G9UIF1_TELCI|nr:hypothetical protein TELCIR_08915 [Teladorsagia circumcincta]